MTKINSSNEWSTWVHEQHKALSLFDSNYKKTSIQHNNTSRIPVLAKNKSRSPYPSTTGRKYLSPLKREGSRIPVQKPLLHPAYSDKTACDLTESSHANSCETYGGYVSDEIRKSESCNHSEISDPAESQATTLERTTNLASRQDMITRFKPNRKTTVKLRGLQLSAVPADIFQRTELQALILSPERESCLEYKLPALPKEIGKLRNLRTLILDTNELQNLPEEVCDLQHLEACTLSNNSLMQLPERFSDLENLSSLHLANNRFTEVPLSVCRLKHLSFLDMSDNTITEVPEEIASLAGELRTLLLFMNNISWLPNSISALTSLTCLWLGENQLKELPEDFGELFRLDWGTRPCSSNIDGNPLVRPPLDVCLQGPYAIRKYFHDLKDISKRLSKTVTFAPNVARKLPVCHKGSS